MRAVAVLLVVLNHADIRGLSGGYLGVDVFFVISGFLITGILVREVRRSGRVSIADFYARRARRILPAASVVLLAIVVASSQLFSYARTDEVLTDVTWAALFAANIHSATSGSDYFAAASFLSPVQHFWSLAVEEQFYLVWPPLIALILFSRRRRGVDQAETTRRLRRLAVAIAVLCGLSLAWSVYRTGTEPTAAYYSTLTRGWELGIGALLALCTASAARLPAAVKLVASWLGLAAIAVSAVTYSAATPLAGYLLLPVLGTALVLAGGIEGPRYGATLVLDRRPMRWIGDISYSLYLWHWPFLVMPPMYLDRDLRLVERMALVVAAVGASALSYRLIETPVRRASLLSRKRIMALAMWPAAAVIVISGCAVVQFRHEQQAAAPYVMPSVDPEPETVQDDMDPAVNAAGFAAELARAEHALPKVLKPSLDKLYADVSRPPNGCFAERDDVKHTICPLGDTDAKRTIVVFGDSHSTMWLEPLLRLADQRGWKVVPFMKAGCVPADVTVWRAEKNRAYTECNEWRRWAYAEIARIRPDRIITSGLIGRTLADPVSGRPFPVRDGTAAFATGAQRTLRTLRKLSPEIYVLSATPDLRKNPADCLGSRRATMASCALPIDRPTDERNRIWRKAAGATGAHWVDVVPWFCDKGTCPMVIGNIIAYRDSDHITRTFADSLRSSLARKLRL